MKPRTHYAIMFFIACLLTGIAIKGPKIYGWVLSMDACSMLLSAGVFLLAISFVGRNELSNEEKLQKKIHEDREERVKWMIEANIERRKKELMQKNNVDVE